MLLLKFLKFCLKVKKNYTLFMKSLEEILIEIAQLQEKIKNMRPLNKGELLEMKKTLQVEFTHHSNAIEGSTLTLGETRLVLEDGLTIGGKTIREIQETLNHKKLFSFLYNFIDSGKSLEEKDILEVHKYVLANIDDENAGLYRKIQVHISGEEALPPKSKDLEKLMKDFIDKYKNIDSENVVIQVANFHYDFVKIHPFIDGNGRTIRILMNIFLMKSGFPLVIIPKIRRMEYIQSLNSQSSQENFVHFFADIILQNMKDYLRMIAS